jgi:hypothetical protein
MVGRIVDQWADAAIQQVRAVSFPGDRPSEQASRALGFRPVDVFARANFPEVQDRLR